MCHAYVPSVVRSGRPVNLSGLRLRSRWRHGWPPAPIATSSTSTVTASSTSSRPAATASYTWTFTDPVEASVRATDTGGNSSTSTFRVRPDDGQHRARGRRSSRSAARSPSGRPSSCGRTANDVDGGTVTSPGISTATRTTTTARRVDATRTFAERGAFIIGLRVTDADGADHDRPAHVQRREPAAGRDVHGLRRDARSRPGRHADRGADGPRRRRDRLARRGISTTTARSTMARARPRT